MSPLIGNKMAAELVLRTHQSIKQTIFAPLIDSDRKIDSAMRGASAETCGARPVKRYMPLLRIRM